MKHKSTPKTESIVKRIDASSPKLETVKLYHNHPLNCLDPNETAVKTSSWESSKCDGCPLQRVCSGSSLQKPASKLLTNKTEAKLNKGL